MCDICVIGQQMLHSIVGVCVPITLQGMMQSNTKLFWKRQLSLVHKAGDVRRKEEKVVVSESAVVATGAAIGCCDRDGVWSGREEEVWRLSPVACRTLRNLWFCESAVGATGVAIGCPYTHVLATDAEWTFETIEHTKPGWFREQGKKEKKTNR
ncbi:hypothetical protein EI94DRAFT_1704362 [Lactarius quietus]|nr:hypothetical protein EI94DRAFT_1704362 [Lactarius quietus]